MTAAQEPIRAGHRGDKTRVAAKVPGGAPAPQDLTEDEENALAAEAERGYDPDKLIPRPHRS